MSHSPKFQALIATIQTASEILHFASNTACELTEDSTFRACTLAEAAGKIAASAEYLRKGIPDEGPRVAEEAAGYAANEIDHALSRVRPILEHSTLRTISSRLEVLRETTRKKEPRHAL